MPADDTPIDPTPADPPPADDVLPGGARGWLARRAEAMLRRSRPARPALNEPGSSQVVLQVTGAKPVHVIAVVSDATGLDFISAGNLVQDGPVVVVSGISEASAERLVERLRKAGAKAVAGEAYRPQ